MTRFRWLLALLSATGLILIGSARWSLLAQSPKMPRGGASAPAVRGSQPLATAPRVSIQDALLRPMDLPFAEETPLEGVAAFLRRALGARVVLDRAALDRQGIGPDETVRLELEGVRLKTGLKLLLDQVGLTYRVVPEDNLLILTDAEGSDDPMERVLSQLKSLHNDVHELQNSVDDLLDLAYGDEEDRRSILVAAPRPRDQHAGPRRHRVR
jgi:hypothetical protein